MVSILKLVSVVLFLSEGRAFLRTKWARPITSSQATLEPRTATPPPLETQIKPKHYTGNPGKLILIRHGESLLNEEVTLTGWMDSDLSDSGKKVMEHAGRLMLERGYTDVDVVYTSRLRRAIRSAWVLLKELNSIFRPLENSWRLNQRHFGALEGVKLDELIAELGEERVQEYRSSLYVRPPPMGPDHPNWHRNERKYAELAEEDIPTSESIYDCWLRTIPFYEETLVPDLMAGKTVMVVAHANSLRGLVRHIDGLSDAQVQSISLPSGIPFVYSFDNSLKPIKHPSSFPPMSSCFLESPKALKLLLQKDKAWGNQTEYDKYRGLYSLIDYGEKGFIVPSSGVPLMAGLSTLEREREVMEQQVGMGDDIDTTETDAFFLEGKKDGKKLEPPPNPAGMLNPADYESTIGDNFIVFIRHGQTEYNKLGIFTGWDDAPLAEDGRKQAHEAGKLLRLHGIQFDIVYTSWLSRAIETAWAVVDELDLLWLPVIKSWRLNERMYGALTGMSKKGIAEKFGDAQLKSWRRGYAVQPPPVNSFSTNYPGNDDRYFKYVTDLRVSFTESLMRSISKGRFEIHRKFPKTESLRDCMTRTIPFYTNEIVPNGVSKGKCVLVASSENAIR